MFPPWSQKELSGYDVPEAQQIVRFGDGPAMAINPADYGLPINPDGTVSLLHGTTKDAASKIIREGKLRSAGEPSVYLTNARDAGYGDGTLVQVDVDPRRLFIDDEFPSGRYDFSMPTRGGVANVSNARIPRPRNALGQEIPPTPYELAHAEAQRVAALPVEQGGLGLPPDNTAMDRARAMGYKNAIELNDESLSRYWLHPPKWLNRPCIASSENPQTVPECHPKALRLPPHGILPQAQLDPCRWRKARRHSPASWGSCRLRQAIHRLACRQHPGQRR